MFVCLLILSVEDNYVRHVKKNKIFFHEDIKIHVNAKKKGLKNTHQTGNSVHLSPAK